MGQLPLWDKPYAGRILKGEWLLLNNNTLVNFNTLWACGDQNTLKVH